jgi:hypothetical protein
MCFLIFQLECVSSNYLKVIKRWMETHDWFSLRVTYFAGVCLKLVWINSCITEVKSTALIRNFSHQHNKMSHSIFAVCSVALKIAITSFCDSRLNQNSSKTDWNSFIYEFYDRASSKVWKKPRKALNHEKFKFQGSWELLLSYIIPYAVVLLIYIIFLRL